MFLRWSVTLSLMLLSVPALAQTPPEQPATPLLADSCETGVISYIFLDNASIFDLSDDDLDGRFRWAYRTANRLHRRTRESVIMRELLFDPGDCYDPYLADETERLLRGYSFLSNVDVFAVPQPDGTYHVVVDTRDSWSTQVDVRLSSEGGIGLEGISLSEDNLLGTGRALSVFYFEREVTRDYGISYFTPQLFGTRWDLRSALGRSRAGTFVEQELAYPFVGEVSRWAGRQSFRRDDRFFDYVMNDGSDGDRARLLLPMREQAFDLALLRRIGRQGNNALVGGALSYQEMSYPGTPAVTLNGRFDEREPAPDSLAAKVVSQRQQVDNIRMFVMLGHRNVWWINRRGLDSMRGEEDVRLGAEAIVALGRSLPSLEIDDDLYSMLDLYAAMEIGDMLLIGRTRADARRDLNAGAGQPEWEDLYADSELVAYLQTDALPRQTIMLRVAGTGAWNTRTPFQLTLGGRTALRGYDSERMPGGRRIVASLEDRFFIGWPLPDVLDLGGTLFVDGGRMWPGDAPFGLDSGWRGSAGIGLRGSFPAGSRSTYRVDLAWPLDRGTGFGDFKLFLTVGEFRGLDSKPDRQLVRSRTQEVGGSLFTFRR